MAEQMVNLKGICSFNVVVVMVIVITVEVLSWRCKLQRGNVVWLASSQPVSVLSMSSKHPWAYG